MLKTYSVPNFQKLKQNPQICTKFNGWFRNLVGRGGVVQLGSLYNGCDRGGPAKVRACKSNYFLKVNINLQ